MTRNNFAHSQLKVTELILKSLKYERDSRFVRLQLLHYVLNRDIRLDDYPVTPEREVVLTRLLRQRHADEIPGHLRRHRLVSKYRLVVGESSLPPAFLDAIDALDALRDLREDLAVHRRPRIRLPLQNPLERHGRGEE